METHSFKIIVNILVSFFPFHLNIYVMGFKCGDRFYTSESDLCRRQILTYQVDPRAEWVKTKGIQNHTRM